MTRPTCRLLFAALALALAAGAARADDPLQAGFADADITPKLDGKKPVYVAGFAHNRKATGVADPLAARAAILRHGKRRLALVGVDLIGFFHPRVENIRKRLPDFEYVLVSATHTHEGPDAIGLWGPTPFSTGTDPEYLKFVEDQVVAAVQAADKAAVPVKARIGTARVPELLRDARPPEVLHDELTSLSFAHAETGKAAGLVIFWNCHPETLESRQTKLSCDFVGPCVRALTPKHGPVVYLTGTVGGLMTSIGVPIEEKGVRLPEGSQEKTEAYGRKLADAADKAVTAAKPLALTPWDLQPKVVFLPVVNPLYQLASSLGVVDRQVFLWTGDLEKAEPAPKKRDAKAELCVRTEVGVLYLGDLAVAAIPGEIYPELVLDAPPPAGDRDADFPDAPFEPTVYAALKSAKHRVLIGLANDEIGYILPKRQWDEEAPFAYGLKQKPYGEINSLGPDTAPLLLGVFRKLAEKK